MITCKETLGNLLRFNSLFGLVVTVYGLSYARLALLIYGGVNLSDSSGTFDWKQFRFEIIAGSIIWYHTIIAVLTKFEVLDKWLYISILTKKLLAQCPFLCNLWKLIIFIENHSGPMLLQWYCPYIAVCGINGVSECFYFATMSQVGGYVTTLFTNLQIYM